MTKLTKIHAMVKEISTICEIKMIREQKSRLSERERELTQPMFTDTSIIPALYKYYSDKYGVPSKRRSSTRHNQKFSFVVLFLFSPSSLAGGVMGAGIRDSLASVIGFKSPTGVSNLCKNIMFQYDNYKEYRMEVDEIYTLLVGYAKELINK